MRKVSKVILVAVCFMLTATTLATAVGISGYVELVQKDPVTWQPVPGGAYGNYLTYSSGYYKWGFVGQLLKPNTQYTLISYKEPGASWPATGCKVIGTATTNAYGMIKLFGYSVPTYVYNTYTSGEYAGKTGAKIWLVLSSDMSGTTLSGWNPADYLFEKNLL